MSDTMNSPAAAALPAEDRLLTGKEVADIFGIHHVTVWRSVREGKLPPPLKLGRSARWPMSDVQALLGRMREERDAYAKTIAAQ